jgi:hypothetical protein
LNVSTARIVVVAAGLLLILSGTAFGLTVALRSESDSTSIVRERISRIVIRADSGDVDVRAGLTGNVIVDRRDSWLFSRPDVVQTVRDGTLTIKSKCNGVMSAIRCRSDLTIDTPPELDLVVRTKSGDVDLRGISGRVQVRTDAGAIRAHRVDPVTFTATSKAGDVSLDVVGQPARTVADTGGGNIDIVVPFGAYRVDAGSGSGNVSVRGLLRDDLAPQAIHAMTDAGNVKVRAR